MLRGKKVFDIRNGPACRGCKALLPCIKVRDELSSDYTEFREYPKSLAEAFGIYIFTIIDTHCPECLKEERVDPMRDFVIWESDPVLRNSISKLEKIRDSGEIKDGYYYVRRDCPRLFVVEHSKRGTGPQSRIGKVGLVCGTCGHKYKVEHLPIPEGIRIGT